MSKFIENIKERRSKKKNINITQQNLEESREEILTKGKKFKYPFQYAKHRIVISAIAIAVVAIATFVGIGWYQLYKAQNTGEVMYRFTKVLGLPVAEIDGHKVLYSDYLMLYRSSITSIERQRGKLDDSDEEIKALKVFYKRQALNDAEMYAYVLAELEARNLTVSASEIDEVIDGHKSIDGEKRSDEAFEGIVRDNFGLNMSEYRRLIMLSLAKRKLSVEIDEDAKKAAEEVEDALRAHGNNFSKVADIMKNNDLISYEAAGNAVEVSNLDSGRAEVAMKLEKKGDVSERFISKNGDGYYYVRLVAKDDKKVSYETISIRFSKVDNDVQKLRDDGKVTENIEVKIDASDEESATESPDSKENE
ncbi:SurA N-terminal domain-containing protein [Candidatus Saccharibacteria bacterium]|nr:SurA N-terminal domain-containing protein [Candidatus Saccharibacteria bacterium]MBP5656764.1 SurA N-terminal domain-containing protein [Candidatus Saccharibacteria bacterium]